MLRKSSEMTSMFSFSTLWILCSHGYDMRALHCSILVSDFVTYNFQVFWLHQSYIHMKNPHEVKEKINNIIGGGKNKIQIIFDFDRTLTKHHENGVLTKSSFGKSS